MTQVDELIRAVELPDTAEWRGDEAVEGEARARLQTAIRAESERRQSGARWRWTGPKRLVIPAAASCALAAAIVVVLALLPGSSQNETLLGGPGPATAQTVLERAAAIASRSIYSFPASHQFLYLKWINGNSATTSYKGHRFGLTDAYVEQDWEAANGSGRQKLDKGTMHFFTPHDLAEWRAAKTTEGNEPALDGTYPVGAYFDNCDIQLDKLSTLSTNPTVLLHQIEKITGAKTQVVQSIMRTVACALQASQKPALNAALYRVVEHLPGIKLLGSRDDYIGRSGVAVAVDVPHFQEVLIIDPITAAPLEFEYVQTSRIPGGPNSNVPDGTPVNFAVYLAHGVVKTMTALPGGGTVPMKVHHHPPLTAPAVPANPAQPLVTTISALKVELSILRRPQTAADRLPAWAVAEEQREGCSNCFNVPRLLLGETRLIGTVRTPPASEGTNFGHNNPEHIYLVVGIGQYVWHYGKPGLPVTRVTTGLHADVVGFSARQEFMKSPLKGHKPSVLEEPLDQALDGARLPMPTTPLAPAEVAITQYGMFGIVPDDVTKVRWELIDPGQWRPITVYPTIKDNVAYAPTLNAPKGLGLGDEQDLASAVWYGADGKVIATVNELPGLVKYQGGWN
jgi:hypothetical protein